MLHLIGVQLTLSEHLLKVSLSWSVWIAGKMTKNTAAWQVLLNIQLDFPLIWLLLCSSFRILKQRFLDLLSTDTWCIEGLSQPLLFEVWRGYLSHVLWSILLIYCHCIGMTYGFFRNMALHYSIRLGIEAVRLRHRRASPSPTWRRRILLFIFRRVLTRRCCGTWWLYLLGQVMLVIKLMRLLLAYLWWLLVLSASHS